MNCPHCSKDLGEDAVSKADHLARLNAKTEKLKEIETQRDEARAKAAESEKRAGRVGELEKQLADLGAQVERSGRVEALLGAGVDLGDETASARRLKAFGIAYDDYAQTERDAKREPAAFAAWLGAEDGARADAMVSGWFGQAGATPLASVAPPAARPPGNSSTVITAPPRNGAKLTQDQYNAAKAPLMAERWSAKPDRVTQIDAELASLQLRAAG